MGAATVLEMVSALAPGYAVLMDTVGGEISGYCETGRLNDEMMPASVTRMAMTLAKIGRSMKNFEKLPMDPPSARRSWSARAGRWRERRRARGHATGEPGRTFTRLSMITMSPSASPAVTTALEPIQLAIFTDLEAALPSRPAVITMRDCSFCRIACCGTRMAFCSPASTRTFTNCPGSSLVPGFGNSARSCTVPSLVSTVLP